jgi:hypothetical protein
MRRYAKVRLMSWRAAILFCWSAAMYLRSKDVGAPLYHSLSPDPHNVTPAQPLAIYGGVKLIALAESRTRFGRRASH